MGKNNKGLHWLRRTGITLLCLSVLGCSVPVMAMEEPVQAEPQVESEQQVTVEAPQKQTAEPALNAAEEPDQEEPSTEPGVTPGTTPGTGSEGIPSSEPSTDPGTEPSTEPQTEPEEPQPKPEPKPQPKDTRVWSKDKQTYINKGAYYNKAGKKLSGFAKVDGVRFYFSSTGQKKTGVIKIGKAWYLVDPSRGTPAKAGFVNSAGKRYYAAAGGKLTTGWVALGKKAYYFYPSGKTPGAMARKTRIGHLKIPASGALGEAYALGIKTLNKKGWSLRAAYRFSYKLKYQGRHYRTKTSEKYALKGFKKKKGNCFVMAATFYIMAKLLGYDVHQIKGRVSVPHSWTIIKQHGKTYVYDPNFQNEIHRNGFKIWYGKKGTWRYNHYKRMN